MCYEIIIGIFIIFLFILNLAWIAAVEEENEVAIFIVGIVIIISLLIEVGLLSNNYEVKKDMSRIIVENNLTKKVKNSDTDEFIKKYILNEYIEKKKKELEKN